MPSLIGTNIGDYVVRELLGSGGMGTVYRAVHHRLQRVAAIKVLTDTQPATGQSVRFLQEARFQANFQHPGIATLYDLVEQDRQLCIVMEYVPGETLTELLRQRGPFSCAEALRILQGTSEAVAYLHRQGVVHRDIKASNIKVTPEGAVKLLDFGVAASVGACTTLDNGAIAGTFQYMAPEQLDGLAADGRSDIWALGVVLFEMVTGRLPFEGVTLPDLCRHIRLSELPRELLTKARVGREVQEVIRRCLAKDPPARFQTADELVRAVRPIRATAGSGALPDRSFATLLSPLLGRPRVLAVAFSLLLAVLLLFQIMHSSGGSAGDLRSLNIDVMDGPAEVYRDGRALGRTPLRLQEPRGEHVSLLLKRPGYEDLPVDFDVTERAAYSYVLQPQQPPVP